MNLFQLSAAYAAAALATAAFAAPVPTTATERALSGSVLPTVLARESEPGDDRRGRGRGRDDPKATEQAPAPMIAREAETGDSRRGRGGDPKASEQAPAITIAREAERGDDHGDDGDEFEIDDHA